MKYPAGFQFNEDGEKYEVFDTSSQDSRIRWVKGRSLNAKVMWIHTDHSINEILKTHSQDPAWSHAENMIRKFATDSDLNILEEKYDECECGAEKTFQNCNGKMHSTWCPKWER